ncbi:hypothetical protein ACQP2T_28115 [Nonomuraea sp. CA-143628]|uniref:hypothetical protein n=1 Tax=Nonomuraea sp. CA-143628 TaxID=3239997 RepID=UPI003D90B386
MTEDPMIAALLRERDGYVQHGLDDRVRQVDEQLGLRGYKPSTDATETSGEGGGQEPPSTPPKGRRTARKATT